MLFVAAEAREFDGLLPLCGSVEKLDWPLDFARTAELNGRQVFLAANGAGPKNAAKAVDFVRYELRGGEIEGVVSTGFCGGLDPALKIGDIFMASNIQVGDRTEPVAAARSERSFAAGTLVSIDRVAQTQEEKRNLYSAGASAVDMEAAGVYSRVREWERPFYCIRSVTDVANESFHIDLNAARKADGRFDTSRILMSAMLRPLTVAPELVRLRGRCNQAAKALGEFLADCSF